MKRREAIKWLIKPTVTCTEISPTKIKEIEAYNMAIEALSEPINCVKCKHYYETEDGTDVHGHCRMDTAHTMTREEAIKKLQKQKAEYLEEWVDYSGVSEAYDMAIEALKAEYIIPSGDVMFTSDIVRCKDCRHWYKKMNKCNRCPSISGNWGANDFCSYRERSVDTE